MSEDGQRVPILQTQKGIMQLILYRDMCSTLLLYLKFSGSGPGGPGIVAGGNLLPPATYQLCIKGCAVPVQTHETVRSHNAA